MVGQYISGKFQKQAGFTVVELMVVVVIIAILAGISFVAYGSYQRGVRDTERKSDLSQLASAIRAYALQKNNYMGDGSNCGLFNSGSGWISLGPSNGGGYYPTNSIAQCLKDAGVITNADDFVDPFGCVSDTGGVCGQYQSTPAQAYMKATCRKNGQPVVYFLTHLESEPRRDAEVDALCDVGSLSWFDANSQKWGTNYGMNYYVTIK